MILSGPYIQRRIQNIVQHPRCSLTIFSKSSIINFWEDDLEAVVRRCSFKKFANFTVKHLCWNLFLIKSEGLKSSNFIETRLQNRCFPVKFAKFLRTPFFTEHLRWQYTSEIIFNFIYKLTKYNYSYSIAFSSCCSNDHWTIIITGFIHFHILQV